MDPYKNDANPSVIVYVRDAAKQRETSEKLIEELFDLSPAEAQLATLLAGGSTLVEASEKLGLTEITVRTYVKRIFMKTGVNRQADLVRLLLTSVAPLA